MFDKFTAKKTKPLIMAHRGNKLHCPENTSINSLSERTVPKPENNSINSVSVVEAGRFPTNTFFKGVLLDRGGRFHGTRNKEPRLSGVPGS